MTRLVRVALCIAATQMSLNAAYGQAPQPSSTKLQVTTASADARTAFWAAWDDASNVFPTRARTQALKAVALDPVTFAITVGDGALGWLKPYARLEGLFWRIIPVDNLRADLDILRANLLERYEYRGYADPAIRIDDVSRMMGLQYFTAFSALLESEEARGATDRCREARTKLFAALPPDRLALPARDREEIEARCRP